MTPLHGDGMLCYVRELKTVLDALQDVKCFEEVTLCSMKPCTGDGGF